MERLPPSGGRCRRQATKRGTSCRAQREGEGSSLQETLSVTAFGRATSPERERLWQRRKVYSLTAGFFLPLTGEDETHPLCQGLPLSGKTSPGRGKMSPTGDKKGNSCRRRRLRGFVPARNPLRHDLWPCHLSREGEALAEWVRPCKKPQGLFKGPGVSCFISLGVCVLIPLRPGRRVLQRRLRPQPPSQPAPPQSALRRLHPAPPSRPVPRRRARCGPAPSPYRPRPGA